MVYSIVEESQNDMVAPGDSLLWHPNSAGHHVFNLNLALIIVSTLLVWLRLYVRKVIVKALGWDDLIATVAWVGDAHPVENASDSLTPTDSLPDTLRLGDGHYPLRHRSPDRRRA